MEIASELVKLLTDNELKCTFAESLTGGLIAATLVNIPGASSVFEGSFVTYSDRIKNEILGVSQNVLETESAVSSFCAEEMASGALEKAAADVAVSVTGIAGPTGDMPGKPVGTVYMGIAVKNFCYSKRFNFTGSRDEIRMQTVEAALKEMKEAVLTLCIK